MFATKIVKRGNKKNSGVAANRRQQTKHAATRCKATASTGFAAIAGPCGRLTRTKALLTVGGFVTRRTWVTKVVTVETTKFLTPSRAQVFSDRSVVL